MIKFKQMMTQSVIPNVTVQFSQQPMTIEQVLQFKNRSRKTIINNNKTMYYVGCEFTNVQLLQIHGIRCKFNNCNINIGNYIQSQFNECKFDTNYAGSISLDTPLLNQCIFFIECIIQGEYIYLDGKKINSPQNRIIKQYRVADYGIMLDDSVNQQMHRNNG